MSNQIYNGLFFKKEHVDIIVKHLNLPVLDKDIVFPHVTFAFKSHDLPESSVGESYDVVVVGYCNNNHNIGLMVELPEELMGLYHNSANTIHITTSHSSDSSPVKTGEIDESEFIILDNKIYMQGTLGYFDRKRGPVIVNKEVSC